MRTTETTRRLSVGETLEPLRLETLAHGTLEVPAKGLVHLQFRRFAGCPVCSLHVRSFALGKSLLDVAGVQTVAFFHSSAEKLARFHAELPFSVVPDPERRWYHRFGVERSFAGLLHPSVGLAALRGIAAGPSAPFALDEDHNGLPADFLVASTGRVEAVKYGSNANDSWSLEEVLDLAAKSSRRS